MAMIVGARLAENPRRGDRTTRLRPVVTDDPRLADLLSTSPFLPRDSLLSVFPSNTERPTVERNIAVTFESRIEPARSRRAVRAGLIRCHEKILFRIGFVIPAICELVNAAV